MSCYAVLFFAVPSRGLDNSSLMSMVKGQPNEDLVRNLSESSPFLGLLHDRFSKCFTLDDSKILGIFETQTTPTVEVSSFSKFRLPHEVLITSSTSGLRRLPHGKEPDPE